MPDLNCNLVCCFLALAATIHTTRSKNSALDMHFLKQCPSGVSCSIDPHSVLALKEVKSEVQLWQYVVANQHNASNCFVFQGTFFYSRLLNICLSFLETRAVCAEMWVCSCSSVESCQRGRAIPAADQREGHTGHDEQTQVGGAANNFGDRMYQQIFLLS